MENCTPGTEAPFQDVASRLRQQLATCDAMVHRCFAKAVDETVYFTGQERALMHAARLVQVSAGLAIALKRLEGSRQDIVVTHTPATA